MRVFLLLTTTSFLIFAQTKFSVSGNVSDQFRKPVEYASVAIKNSKDSSLVAADITDENGFFEFIQIKQGQYYVEATQIGYQKNKSRPFVLDQNIVQHVTLYSNTKALDEVVISGQKSFIEQQADKTVVNVENSIVSTGVSVAEVLKRAPGVTVDKDGGVKLKGKEGVMIMIDDKPLYMEAGQLGAFLKSIPADQVKNIEIMTNPSAKYDAAGNAGIINIKLKKGAYEGFNGNINAAYIQGFYPKANAGINLNYRKKQFTLNIGYQYNYKKNLEQFNIFRTYNDISLPQSKFNTFAFYPNFNYIHSLNMGLGYDINDRNSIQVTLMPTIENGNWIGGSNSDLISRATNTSFQKLESVENSTGFKYNVVSSASYQHKFDTIGTTISVGIDYNKYNDNSNQQFKTIFKNGAGVASQNLSFRSVIPVLVDQYGAKVDFTKTIFWNLKMETGAKFTRIETDNNINFMRPNAIGADSSSANYFVYKENISAAYTNFLKELKSWKFQLGLRSEHTSSIGQNKSLNQSFYRDYLNFFPSTSVNYKLNQNTNFTIQYSRRIDRPDYKSLNPFAYFNDPFTSYAGNPNLLPQYSDNYELVNSFFQGALSLTFNYTNTQQFKGDIYQIDPRTLTTTYTFANIGKLENTGAAVSLYYPVNKWFVSANYFYLYENKVTGFVPNIGNFFNQQVAYIITSTQSFVLPQKFDLEVSFNYESPTAWSIMRYRELWQISFGVRKKMLKDKLIARLAVNDVFWTYYWRGTSEVNNTFIRDEYKWDNRTATLSLTYNFGSKYSAPKTTDQELEEKFKEQENSKDGGRPR